MNSFMLLSILALSSPGERGTVHIPHDVGCASVIGCDPTPCGDEPVLTHGFIVAREPCREPRIPQGPRFPDPIDGSNTPEPPGRIPPIDIKY